MGRDKPSNQKQKKAPEAVPLTNESKDLKPKRIELIETKKKGRKQNRKK
jgi:hypothetical protein